MRDAVKNTDRTDVCLLDKVELKNAKLLYVLMSVLLITDWVMPQYFGIHIGFDFTCTRIMNMVLLVYFLLNRKAGNHFIKSMLDVQMTPYLALYMLVMIYTTILRVNVNTFFLNFLDVLTFYMVYYGIRYVIGIRKTIRWTVKIAWFLGVYGIVEYVLGYSLMFRFLQTVPNEAKILYRSGQYRIMGPCVHSIAYGMMLLLLIAVICIDVEKDELYLFQNPVLYALLMLNIFLTGSRGPLGLAVVESMLIFLFSSSQRKKKTFLILIVLFAGCVMIELALLHTSIGQYIMLQITSVFDEVFGTSLSAKYGADVTLLNQSSSYRELLPRVFTVEWLNPLVGRGANASVGFEFDGAYVRSIDNFYVALYIRYAYPGLITYVLFFLTTLFFMLKTGIRRHSGICMSLAIGFFVYIIGLWWVDYLQTTKYMYILVAIYAAYYSLSKTRVEGAHGKKGDQNS